MLFLTIGNIVLCTIQWLNELFRQKHYGQAMNRIYRTCSFIVQRKKKALVENARRPSLLAITSNWNERLEYEDDYLRISCLDSQLEVDLGTWTSYTNYLESYTKVPQQEDYISVLLESKRPKDVEKFADKTFNIPLASRVNVLKHGCPIAWKSAEPFGIILRCNLQSLSILTDAFGQGRLSLDEDLQLIRIIGVRTKGVPQQLVIQGDNYSSLEEPIHGAEQKQKSGAVTSGYETVKSPFHLSNQGENSTAESSNENLQQERSEEPIPKSEQQKEPESHNSHDNCDFSFTGPKKPIKSPNILVYCGMKDTARVFSDVKATLEACINNDAYTVYHLSHEAMLSAPWAGNAALLVISSCHQLQPVVEDKIFRFVTVHGGRLLSFNCSVDSRFSKTSMNKEARSNSLIKFDYGEDRDITSVRGTQYYTADNEYAEVVVPLDNTEQCSKSDQSKCLILKTCSNGSGVVVLSQLLLERDPTEFAADSKSFALLKHSNTARLSVFRDLLTLLGMDTSPESIMSLTSCLLFVRRVGLKEKFLNSFKHHLRSDNVIKSKHTSLKLVDNLEQEVTSTLLPVVTTIQSDVETRFFYLSEYWHHLKTLTLGQVVFYTEVITTTMTVFDSLQFSIPQDIGVIAIAGRQTSGKGRGSNAWLSPPGCAMFTLPLQLGADSKLAQRVSFLQHMVSLAVVQSVVTLPGYEGLDIRLKWPNDIYYGKEMKLGGVLVTSTIMNSTIYTTIGCGFNVSNSNPTVCINDIIRFYNNSHPESPALSPLSTSQLIARTVTCLERLIDDFNENGHHRFCQEYYKYWLHGGTKVTVQLKEPTEGEIIGLDEFGFLSIRTSDNELLSVQPDGNSFDMMHNLIYVKSL